MTHQIQPPIHAAVLTVSDRCFRSEREDTSGPALLQILVEQLGAQVTESTLVPDDPEKIKSQLLRWCDHATAAPDLICTTGGTGLAPRDFTPEAVSQLIQRPHPQLLELARLRTGQKTPLAYLSRGIAGTRARTLIITLPGSRKGSTETLEALLDILPHAIETLRGKDSHA